MSGPEIKGWCPGALRPMRSGDGYVVRIRPRGGRLSQEQAAGIADLARAHGNGLIDLSARANVQLRGVTEASHTPLIDGLRALDLIDMSAGAEARRNITVTPFWDEGDGTQDMATALAEALTDQNAPDLPGKFGFSIDLAKRSVLRGSSADIRIEWHSTHWLVRGESFVTGALAATPAEAVTAALELAQWFITMGGAHDGRGRMARLWPQDTLRARQGRLPKRFRDGGAVLGAAPVPLPGHYPQGWLAGLEFGQMTADTLAAMAELAALRMSPWRMVLMEGLAAAPVVPGLISNPDHPLLNVIACTGAPGCPQALQPTRTLARALAPAVPPGETLHVSGCSKGCALPGPCAHTLVATANGFAHVRRGSAADAPALTALSPEALIAHPDLLFGTP